MDEKEAEARPLMGTIFLVIFKFDVLTTTVDWFAVISVGTRVML